MLQITLYMLLKVRNTFLYSNGARHKVACNCIANAWKCPNIAEDYRIKALPGIADLGNMTQYAG